MVKHGNWNEFEIELRDLLNRHSIDSACSVPDFRLADYAVVVLQQLAEMNEHKDEPWSGEPTTTTKSNSSVGSQIASIESGNVVER